MREIFSLIFSYSFILYLVLFLLEIIFPGFVSNNFSLNYLLVPTLIFGALSAFFPRAEEKEELKKPASKFDFILLVALTIGSFLLIFYKFAIDNLTLKLAISLLSSAMTLIMGVILLYFPGEPEEERAKELVKEPVKGVPTHLDWSRVIRRSFSSRIHIPVPLALLFVIIILIFIPKNTMKILHAPNSRPTAECPGSPLQGNNTTSAAGLPKADPNVRILVYNAGAEKGDAKRFADIFRNYGYLKVEAMDYPGDQIENASIQFRPSEASQAAVIEDLLKNIYPSVTKAPSATTSADIQVLLGSYPPPENTDTMMENENVNFFFQ